MAKYQIRHSSSNTVLGFAADGDLETTGFTNGAKNGSGTIACKDLSFGPYHVTTLTLTAHPVTVANTTGASFGNVKLYDFPEGRIYMLGGSSNFTTIDWSGTGIGATGSGDYSLGSTATADATLGGTDVDFQASTAMLDPFVAGIGNGSGVFASPAAFDGTATAKDLYLNVIIDDADVSDADSSIVLFTGTVRVVWVDFGDI